MQAGGIVSGMTSGKVYFVDSANGSDANNGKTFASAFASIAAAIAVAVAGDTIFLKGSFSETATAGVAGLSIVGLGTGPKQAQWMSAADTATLTITANYVRVENVYFKPPADRPRRPTARRRSFSRNGARVDITGCRFQGQTGSYNAIYAPTAMFDNVHIVGNEFYYLNTAGNGCGILGVEAGGLSFSG